MDKAISLSNLIHPQHTNLADGSNHPMHIIGQLINDPWYTIDELRNRHKIKDPSHGSGKGEDAMCVPNFDVRETANYYFLEGEFPGIENKNDIHIEWVGQHTLVIEARIAKLDEEAEWGISLGGTDNKSDTEGHEVVAEDRDGSGHKEKTEEPKVWLNDRHTGELQKSFTFPHDVDVENLKARLSNGLLKILVTKIRPEEREPRRKIEIEN